jgi:hypothetical protein
MEIPFRGQIDIDVLRRSMRAGLQPSRRALIGGAILGVFMLWGLVGVPLADGQPLSDLLANLAPALVTVLLAGSLFIYALFFSAPRKVLESNKLIQGGYAGVATEEGVHLETAHSQSDLPWDVFYRAKIGRDVVLLYQSVQVSSVFPREFFATEEDWQAFVGLVRQHVSLRPPRRGNPLKVFILWLVIFLAVVLFYTFFHNGR